MQTRRTLDGPTAMDAPMAWELGTMPALRTYTADEHAEAAHICGLLLGSGCYAPAEAADTARGIVNAERDTIARIQ